MPVVAESLLWQGLYRGHIGSRAITMHLYLPRDTNENVSLKKELVAKYFYESSKKEGLLTTRVKSATSSKKLFLFEKLKNKKTIKWSLSRKNSIITGSRRSAKKKYLRVRLRRIMPINVASEYFYNDAKNIYKSYKLVMKYKKEKPVRVGKIVYVWYQETSRNKKHNIRLPRLVRFPNANIKQKINDLLETRHRLIVEDLKWCHKTAKLTNFDSLSFILDMKVSHITNKTLSLNGTVNWSCSKRAICHNCDNSYVFDLTKGEIFNFDVYFGSVVPKGSLDKKLKELARNQLPKKSSESGCADIYSDTKSYTLAFGSQGIIFKPVISDKSVTACARQVTIPYPLLKPFSNNGYP